MRVGISQRLTFQVLCLSLALLPGCEHHELTEAELQRLPLPKLRNLAEAGDVRAQVTLGHSYFYGLNLRGDRAEAFKWYLKAAEKGSAEAQGMVGYCYGTGEGIPQDDAACLKWTSRGGKQGDPNAQGRLGAMYFFGDNPPPRDLIQAYKWFRLATVSGYKAHDTYPYWREYLKRCAREMTTEQLSEAKRLAEEFTPVPESQPH